MGLRYRRATTDDLTALGPILGTSFGFPATSAVSWFDKTGTENIRVVTDDGVVVGGLLLIPMAQYFGGRSVPTMGIAGVGVSPVARGRGIGSELMRRMLREQRKGQMALSTLFPASVPLYRRAGYETAGGIWQYVVEGRDFPKQRVSLPVRAYEPSDERQVRAVYAHAARGRNGWMDRGPYVWERTRREQHGSPTHGFVFGDLSNERTSLEAYVFYRHKATPLGFELRVSDMASRTPRGHAAVMSFLSGHKSLADEVKWYGGTDDPWLHLLPDRHYKVKLHHHFMLRVVDVAAALEARGYPAGLDGKLVLDVRDELMPAQSGSYRLTVANGRGNVHHLGKSKRTRSRTGVTLDVKTLAALYASHLHADAAAQLGLLEGTAKAVAFAATAFSGPPPSMNDLF